MHVEGVRGRSPGAAGLRTGLAAVILGIGLGGCGASATSQTATAQATATATAAITFSATDLHLEGIAESVRLINACNVPIRCAGASAALVDGVNGLLRTLDARTPSLPHGVPSTFLADVNHLLTAATTLEGVYEGGDQPSPAEVHDANQAISTFNSDLSAGGLTPLAPNLTIS